MHGSVKSIGSILPQLNDSFVLNKDVILVSIFNERFLYMDCISWKQATETVRNRNIWIEIGCYL